MKALTITAAAALTVGILTVLVVDGTWPTWEGSAEQLAGELAGSPRMFAPEGFYALHQAGQVAGQTLCLIGGVGVLLALHARAVRGEA